MENNKKKTNEEIKERVCLNCAKELSFPKHKWCSRKCCDHQKYLNDKERIKKRIKEYIKNNPERMKALSKKAMRNYYVRNRESHLAKVKAYQKAKREQQNHEKDKFEKDV